MTQVSQMIQRLGEGPMADDTELQQVLALTGERASALQVLQGELAAGS